MKTLANATQAMPGTEDATSAFVRATLQGIVSCAGGAASSGGSCGSEALGASGAVALNYALNSLQGTDANTMMPEQKQQRQDLITSILGGLAAATGGNGAAAGAQTELVNNGLSDQINALAAGLKLCTTQKCRDDYNQAIQDAIHGENKKTITSYEQAVPTQDHDSYYKPNGRPFPDYITATGTLPLIGNVNASINTYNFNYYIGVGDGRSYNDPGNGKLSPGWTLVGGTILQDSTTARDVDNFLQGASYSGSVFVPITPFVGVGGGVNHSYGGATSVEYGVGTPGVSVSPAGYSTKTNN